MIMLYVVIIYCILFLSFLGVLSSNPEYLRFIDSSCCLVFVYNDKPLVVILVQQLYS